MHMKKLVALLGTSIVLVTATLIAADSLETNPGYINFEKYVGMHAEESKVEVKLKGPLLRLAASII